MLIKLYARDNEHLMRLLNDRIQMIPGVTGTETLIMTILGWARLYLTSNSLSSMATNSGFSLRSGFRPEIVNKIARQLSEAIDYVQTNHIVHHPIRPETVIFTEIIGNLKVIDVGFDQKNRLEPTDVEDSGRWVISVHLPCCGPEAGG